MKYSPYQNEAIDLIYNLLFCDDISLYKSNTQKPFSYPFDVLFSETSTVSDLQKITDDEKAEPRVKILAYNRLLAEGHKSSKKDLLAVIVEVGLETGLDVLASFRNGTARYINQTGKLIIWETTDTESAQLTDDLFLKSENIVHQIGPWDKERRPPPATGVTRITFLVSDGLYFGEAPTEVLFNDPLAREALASATTLMKYLTDKSLQAN